MFSKTNIGVGGSFPTPMILPIYRESIEAEWKGFHPIPKQKNGQVGANHSKGESMGTIELVWSVTIIAFFCEYLDSSLGMGYGTTLSPLLLILGYDPLQIVPALLVSELITGLSAAFFHQKLKKRVIALIKFFLNFTA